MRKALVKKRIVIGYMQEDLAHRLTKRNAMYTILEIHSQMDCSASSYSVTAIPMVVESPRDVRETSEDLTASMTTSVRLANSAISHASKISTSWVLGFLRPHYPKASNDRSMD